MLHKNKKINRWDQIFSEKKTCDDVIIIIIIIISARGFTAVFEKRF